MKKTDIRTFTMALLSLAAVSCSPIVAEYTYEGKVYGTGRGTSARTLILKEYKDGKISGQLRTRGSADVYSCGSVGGTVQGNSLTLYRSNLGSNYLAASMASGSAIATYTGKLSNRKRSLNGSWRSSNRLKRGSFRFYMTHFNGKPIRRPITTGSGPEEPDGGILIEEATPEVAPPDDVGMEI